MLKLTHFDLRLSQLALLFNVFDDIHNALDIAFVALDDDQSRFRNKLNLGITDWAGRIFAFRVGISRGNICCPIRCRVPAFVLERCGAEVRLGSVGCRSC